MWLGMELLTGWNSEDEEKEQQDQDRRSKMKKRLCIEREGKRAC